MGGFKLEWIEELAQAYSGEDLTDNRRRRAKKLEEKVLGKQERFVELTREEIAHSGYTKPETVVDIVQTAIKMRTRLEADLRKNGVDPGLISQIQEELGRPVFYEKDKRILQEKGIDPSVLDTHLDQAATQLRGLMHSILTRYDRISASHTKAMAEIGSYTRRDKKLNLDDEEVKDESDEKTVGGFFGMFDGMAQTFSESSDHIFEIEDLDEDNEDTWAQLEQERKDARSVPYFSFDEQIKMTQIAAQYLLSGAIDSLADIHGKLGEEDHTQTHNIDRVSAFGTYLEDLGTILDGLGNVRPAGSVYSVGLLLQDKARLQAAVEKGDVQEIKTYYAHSISAIASLSGLTFKKRDVEHFLFTTGDAVTLAVETAKNYRDNLSLRIMQPLVIPKGERELTEVSSNHLGIAIGGEDSIHPDNLWKMMIYDALFNEGENGLEDNEQYLGFASNKTNIESLGERLASLGVDKRIGEIFELRLRHELAEKELIESADINRREEGKLRGGVVDETAAQWTAQHNYAFRKRTSGLLHKIERLFFEMPEYDHRHPKDTEGSVGTVVGKEIKDRTQKIQRHAQELYDIAQETLDVHSNPDLRAMGVESELAATLLHVAKIAGALQTGDEFYSDVTELDKKGAVYAAVVAAHTQLRGVGFKRSKTHNLSYAHGDHLEFLMRVAQHYERVVEEKIRQSDKMLESTILDDIVELCLSDSNLQKMMGDLNNPLSRIESELSAFGVPSNIADRLGRKIRDRVIFGESKKSKREKTSSRDLKIGSGKEAKAYQGFLGSLKGQEIKPFKFRRYGPDDRPISRHIVRETSVTTTHRGPEEMVCTFEYKDHEQFLDIAEKFPDQEIYGSGNLGVSFVFEITPTGFAKVPEKGHIESIVYDEGDLDTLLGKAQDMQVAAHETEHVAQIDSRVMWRYLLTAVTTYLADFTAKKMSRNVLDRDAYFRGSSAADLLQADTGENASSDMKQGKATRTWRELIVECLDMFGAQALGQGPLADRMREHGMLEGFILYDENGEQIQGTEHKDYNKLIEAVFREELAKIELEGGETADYFKRVRYEISGKRSSGTLKPNLERLWREGKSRMEAFATLIETDAEIVGTVFMEKMMKKTYGLKRDNPTIKIPYERLLVQGKMGTEFFNIVGDSEEITKDMEERLNEKGMRYQRAVDRWYEAKILSENLERLGYDKDTAFRAHNDMKELKRRLEHWNETCDSYNKEMSLADVCIPMNKKRATVAQRYRSNLKRAMRIVKRDGLGAFWDKVNNAHTMADLLGDKDLGIKKAEFVESSAELSAITDPGSYTEK